MSLNKILYKSLGSDVSVKDVDLTKRTVTGYFASFTDKPDSDGDIISPTAFSKTLQERGVNSKKSRIVHLYQHQFDKVLARPSVLKTDSFGLYFESKIADTTLGNDVLTLYQEGILDEHSIGFNVIKSEYSEELGANVLKEIRLWEGSTVTWGANENTPFMGAKGLNNPNVFKEQLETIYKKLKRLNVSDETYIEIEIGIKQLISMCETEAGDTSKNSDIDVNAEMFGYSLQSKLLIEKINQKVRG